MSRTPVISVRDVYKSFGDLDVLRGVDLDLYEAENLVVLGRSGTGKSVLIKLVVGLLRPDRGEVVVLGQRVPDLRRRQLDALRVRVGFCFQHSALYDSMTVKQNLEFPLRANFPRLPRSEVEDRVHEVLDAMHLSQALHQMPSELSGGQRKRIGIARTLILRPEIMLYDEPTAGLDPISSTEINGLIREVQETYRTSSIIITHDLTCAYETGDRVAMLDGGLVVKLGTFDEVFDTDDPRLLAFYDYNFTKRETA